jgi:hypothetical protein
LYTIFTEVGISIALFKVHITAENTCIFSMTPVVMLITFYCFHCERYPHPHFPHAAWDNKVISAFNSMHMSVFLNIYLFNNAVSSELAQPYEWKCSELICFFRIIVASVLRTKSYLSLCHSCVTSPHT